MHRSGRLFVNLCKGGCADSEPHRRRGEVGRRAAGRLRQALAAALEGCQAGACGGSSAHADAGLGPRRRAGRAVRSARQARPVEEGTAPQLRGCLCPYRRACVGPLRHRCPSALAVSPLPGVPFCPRAMRRAPGQEAALYRRWRIPSQMEVLLQGEGDVVDHFGLSGHLSSGKPVREWHSDGLYDQAQCGARAWQARTPHTRTHPRSTRAPPAPHPPTRPHRRRRLQPRRCTPGPTKSAAGTPSS